MSSIGALYRSRAIALLARRPATGALRSLTSSRNASEAVVMSQTARGMNSSSAKSVEEIAVRLWVERFVVGINLCPFARPLLSPTPQRHAIGQESIRYVVVQSRVAAGTHADRSDGASDNEETTTAAGGGRTKAPSRKLRHQMAVRDCASKILSEAMELAKGESSPHRTTLNVVPEFKSFDAFLDLSEVIEGAIESKGLSDVVQVATFHPNYCFEDASDARDVGNWTNRSPFPVIHLIKAADVSRGIDEYKGKTDVIWKRNVKVMERMGVDQLREMMSALLRDAKAQAAESEASADDIKLK